MSGLSCLPSSEHDTGMSYFLSASHCTCDALAIPLCNLLFIGALPLAGLLPGKLHQFCFADDARAKHACNILRPLVFDFFAEVSFPALSAGSLALGVSHCTCLGGDSERGDICCADWARSFRHFDGLRGVVVFRTRRGTRQDYLSSAMVILAYVVMKV